MHETAVELARDYGFSFMMHSSLRLRSHSIARVFSTEDMQDGRVVMNLTIRNPFASPPELGH